MFSNQSVKACVIYETVIADEKEIPFDNCSFGTRWLVGL